MRRLGAALLATVLLCAGSACGTPTPGPKVSPAPPQPEAGVSSVSAEAAPPTVDLGVAVTDLQQLDWDRVPVPPGFCGIPTVVQIDGGMAQAASGTWGRVTVGLIGVTYGDLLEDDADEAAVNVYCDNGGGTGASTLEYGIVVYTGRAGRLTSLGVLSAQMQEANQLPTTLSVQEWSDRSLLVTEHYYRVSDSTCCPSGTAETRWTWKDDSPTPGAPHVIE